VHHQFRAVEYASDIDAHQRRRHHAEVRERRIAPADARHAEEHLTEPLALGNLLKRRAGIGDGHEVTAGMRLSDSALHAFLKIFQQEDGLERRAGLARHDEERVRQVQGTLGR
jgi:hypothetical protein